MAFMLDDASNAGTTADVAARLRSTLPDGWFPASPPAPAASATPVLDGLLAGLAQGWSFCFGLLAAVATQARLATADGSFLDMISADYFGASLPRRSGEKDVVYRGRIGASLISRHGTRQDVVQAVTGLTALAPLVCEPERGADCGGYGGITAQGSGGGAGYGSAGLRYGSGSLAFQYLVHVPCYVSFAPQQASLRDTPATYVDAAGFIQVAACRVLRPAYQKGICIGPLLEGRGFNLIVDSRFWSGFAQSPVGGGTSMSWLIGASAPGLFGTDPVISVSGVAGTHVVGPSIDVASGAGMATGSVWIFVASASTLNNVEMALLDLNTPENIVSIAADMTRPEQWQRLSASIAMPSAPGKNLRMQLQLSGSGVSDGSVATQCWQIEPGSVVTSYIPTAGTLGIRAQDDAMSVSPIAVPTSFTVADAQAMVASTIPAATIAWAEIAVSIAV